MGDLRPAFGRRIRQLRLDRGWSQERLAERAGMHWTYISGVERGRRNPSLNVMGQLARALKVTATELLMGVESDAQPAPASRDRRRHAKGRRP